MQRRSMIKAGLVVPFAPLLLSACNGNGNSQAPDGMYLSGNYGPVDVETTATDLRVTGSIPKELIGRYLRNGPNPIGDVDAGDHHWFIGDGMVHGIRLNNGRAEWYRNRWVKTESVLSALGQPIPERDLGQGCNTNVIGHAGRTWAVMESGAKPVELSYELETLGVSPAWGGYTAHPKVDPVTGELHAICYDWANLRDHVKYVVMNADATLKKSVDVPLPGMPMIHDMSLTENYAILYDLPVTLSFMALATGASFPFRWDAEYEPRVGLMPRNGDPKDTIWCSLDSPQYAYHPMNAFEDSEGNVVIDICRYDKMFAADTLGPFGDSDPRFDRWTANIKTRKVSSVRIDDRGLEFPRCHPDLNTQPYRYGYTLMANSAYSFSSEGSGFPAIVKHDMSTGESSTFDLGPGRHAAEPYFVPREQASSEDDGYILTIVYDEKTKVSDLMIFDALDSTREPLATVHLPARVPFGFHGNWIPDATTTLAKV